MEGNVVTITGLTSWHAQSVCCHKCSLDVESTCSSQARQHIQDYIGSALNLDRNVSNVFASMKRPDAALPIATLAAGNKLIAILAGEKICSRYFDERLVMCLSD